MRISDTAHRCAERDFGEPRRKLPHRKSCPISDSVYQKSEPRHPKSSTQERHGSVSRFFMPARVLVNTRERVVGRIESLCKITVLVLWMTKILTSGDACQPTSRIRVACTLRASRHRRPRRARACAQWRRPGQGRQPFSGRLRRRKEGRRLRERQRPSRKRQTTAGCGPSGRTHGERATTKGVRGEWGRQAPLVRQR